MQLQSRLVRAVGGVRSSYLFQGQFIHSLGTYKKEFGIWAFWAIFSTCVSHASNVHKRTQGGFGAISALFGTFCDLQWADWAHTWSEFGKR